MGFDWERIEGKPGEHQTAIAAVCTILFFKLKTKQRDWKITPELADK
jgi:hypothetical protein